MEPEDAGVGRAEADGGIDEDGGFYRETERMGQASKLWNLIDGDGDDDVFYTGTEDGDDCEGDDDAWEGKHDIHHAHDGGLEAATPTGDETEDDADGPAD